MPFTGRTDAGERWLKEHPEASKELMSLLSEAGGLAQLAGFVVLLLPITHLRKL